MSSVRQTAFKLVVAGGIAVASGLLALYKFSIEPVVLEDADGLGLVPGSSSMAGGSMSSSGSTTPDLSSLKRSLSPSPQVGMSRLGSFSTLATLAEEDEEEYATAPFLHYVFVTIGSGTRARRLSRRNFSRLLPPLRWLLPPALLPRKKSLIGAMTTIRCSSRYNQLQLPVHKQHLPAQQNLAK